MSNEIPTIPESAFVYAMNLVKIDAARTLIAKLTPCDILKESDKDELLLILKTMWKEHDDAFQVEADEEKDTHKNVHVNEEVMGGDEEGDVDVKKHESIHDNRKDDEPPQKIDFENLH